MNRSIKTFIVPMSFKDTGEGTFTGMANVAGILDLGGDRVLAGAFDTDLQQRGARRPLLWMHDAHEPLGTVELASVPEGLRVTLGRLTLEVQRAREAYALLKTPGALGGMSIGYEIPDGGDRVERDGTRTIAAARVWEVSLVSFPMNPDSVVESVKAQQHTACDAFSRTARENAAWAKRHRQQRMDPIERFLDTLNTEISK